MASQLPGRPDPAAQVRGGRPAGGAARASSRCTMRLQRRAHRQARGRLRGARADRADAAVRPGGLVRRAGGRARLQRLGQVALPAAARRRRDRPRRGAPAGRRLAVVTGAHTGRARARRAGAARLVRPDPRSTRSWSAAPCWRSCTAATSTGTGCRASRRRGRWTATSWPHAAEQTVRVALRRSAGAVPDPAARAVRGDAAAARRADRQPRPASPPRRWRRASTRSRGPCSR